MSAVEISKKNIRRYVVKKFGGTSCGTGERMLLISDIVKNTLKSNDVIVVVSAMSTQIKTDGTTTRLLLAAEQAVNNKMKQAHLTLSKIKTAHTIAIHNALGESEESQTLQLEISEDIDELDAFLKAIGVIGELTPLSIDAVMGIGEKLSAKILTAVLKSRDIDAVYVPVDKIIKRGEKPDDLFMHVRRRLKEAVEKHAKGKVAVLSGFFGEVPKGMLNAVGRGYSDFTAAMIAAEISASELQLWKEVDGVFTADPRKVPTACVLKEISPEEAAEMSWFGAEVIHPFTMEHVVKAMVPIRIKNTLKPDLPGTVINPNASTPTLVSKRGAICVSRKDECTVINVMPKMRKTAHEFHKDVFDVLDKYKVQTCMVSTSTVSMSIVVPTSVTIEDVIAELDKFAVTNSESNMCIISLIGTRMKANIGAAGRMFTILAARNINIEMISQGANEINISCLIRKDQSLEALIGIHDDIIEEKELST